MDRQRFDRRHLFLVCLVLFIGFLYWTKPQQVIDTKIVEKEVHACDKLENWRDTRVCVVAEACAKGGGKLENYELDTNSNPKFGCKY